MSQATIDHLIINSPYEEPGKYWDYDRESRLFDEKKGRRPAGYVKATPGSKGFDDPGVFVELPLVNTIRPRVQAWREAGYPGATGITRRLLEHWHDREQRTAPFFFCQLEAVETLIWLIEAPEADRVGIEIPSDGSAFERVCAKMATGTGKTVVMAMVIVWQVLNKITSPQDTRFSKNIFIVAPGLTVKSRLGVLDPAAPDNYYQAFDVVPGGLLEKLRQGKVKVVNWHLLGWESDEQISKKRSVDKRGAKSDEAYVRDALGDMARVHDILVINDEAHHAWRINEGAAGKYTRHRDMKDSAEEATVWVGGLDRIHKTRGILRCYDFSATPFAPSGGKSSEETLFGWVVSDFGLNDAIEAGLVKTPRMVVRDDALPDARTYQSRLYHIYNDPEVKDDLNRKAEPEEPLPDLVSTAYHLLGYDWRKTYAVWREASLSTPPVMITVTNRTETAARIKHAFDKKKIRIEELCNPELTLHIDSKVLKSAEEQEEPVVISEGDKGEEGGDGDSAKEKKLTQKEKAELLRRQVDTIGKQGKPGEKIQNVISVDMLSEGWDARTVTHIMGLRAFGSQLLCEQVVGRGLRRTSYEVNSEGFFEPEYVNVFGVPFIFYESGGDGPPPPEGPKKAIMPVPDKQQFEISWPHVIRIDHSYRPRLTLDMSKVELLALDASKTQKIAELAPVVEGRPDIGNVSEINLEKLAHEYRYQRITFATAQDIYEQMEPNWSGNKEYLLAQLVGLVDQFIKSDKIRVIPRSFNQNELKRRLMIILNMTMVMQHIWQSIRFANTEVVTPVFDLDKPIRATGDMFTWYTKKPCEYTSKSHINYCVLDSTWESSDAFKLDRSDAVDAWVKNDHLGFEILYVHRGVVRKYRPDFIVKLKTGEFMVLETKGQDDEESQAKRRFLSEWCRAVNDHGGFGNWRDEIAKSPTALTDILANMPND